MRHADEVPVDCLRFEIALLVKVDLDGRIHREQKALVVNGHAVSCKEDERRVLARDPVLEVVQKRRHLAMVGIGGQQHVKSQALQLLRDVLASLAGFTRAVTFS